MFSIGNTFPRLHLTFRTFLHICKKAFLFRRQNFKFHNLYLPFFFSENLHDMLGDLFLPVETPEAPSRGFFKGLFGSGSSSLDREELCKQNDPFFIKKQKNESNRLIVHFFFFNKTEAILYLIKINISIQGVFGPNFIITAAIDF